MKKIKIINLVKSQHEKLITLAEKYKIPVEQWELFTCADERTGCRFGGAIKRAGRARKLGYTTYVSQTWAVSPKRLIEEA